MVRPLAWSAALFAALWGAAACDGHLANTSAEVDASLGVTSLPDAIDGSAASSPSTGDAGVVDLLLDSGPPPYDSASSLPPGDSSLPPWGYGLDASPPDPFDASCGLPAEVFVADPAPDTCELTPADVACNAASDCTVLMVGHCCTSNVYGMNRGSSATCPMPPCIPPNGGCGASGLITDDCSNVPSLSDVGVACIDHRCRTFAASTP